MILLQIAGGGAADTVAIPLWQVLAVIGALITALGTVWLAWRKDKANYRADVKEFTKAVIEQTRVHAESNANSARLAGSIDSMDGTLNRVNENILRALK